MEREPSAVSSFTRFKSASGFQTLGTGVFQRRLVFGNHRFRTSALLQVVIKSCNFHCQLRLGLMDALAIDTVIYLQQQLAFFNLREILNMDLGNVAVYLRTDERSLAAHVGVIGKLGMTRERGQLPGHKGSPVLRQCR